MRGLTPATDPGHPGHPATPSAFWKRGAPSDLEAILAAVPDVALRTRP